MDLSIDDDSDGNKKTKLQLDDDSNGSKMTKLQLDDDSDGSKTTKLKLDDDLDGSKTTKLQLDDDSDGSKKTKLQHDYADRIDDDSDGSKKTKLQHDYADRLSELPEALILRILSMLEMKDVVRTSILSTAWRHRWTKVDTLVHKSCIRDQKTMSWEQIKELKAFQERQGMSFLDQTLRCTSHIRKFYLSHLSCMPVMLECRNRDMHVLLDKAIEHVLERNVEFLKLKVNSYNMPACVYQSSSLTKLKLDHVNLGVYSPVEWPSLKSLSLTNVLLAGANECVENMLIGCPVLEDVVFEGNISTEHINIMSPRMKRLRIINYAYSMYGKQHETLKINVPWLQELEILGNFYVNECELVDVSSLMKATVTFHTYNPVLKNSGGEVEALNWKNWVTWYNKKWIDMVTELLKSLRHVGDLTIGSDPIQVLSLLKLKGTPFQMLNCKHVVVESSLWKFDIPGIAFLLGNAPQLETLLIKAAFRSQDSFPLPQTEELFDNGDPHLRIMDVDLANLRNVKIDYWQRPWYDSFSGNMITEYFDFEIVKFMIMSDVTMEKLVLCSSSKNNFCRSRMLSLSHLIETFLIKNKVAGEWELKKVNGGELLYNFWKNISPLED